MHEIPDIAECIELNLKRYFQDLDGEMPNRVYDMVLAQVEKPLLVAVLHACEGNRSRAAEVLGLHRNTLRKKLAQYGLAE